MSEASAPRQSQPRALAEFALVDGVLTLHCPTLNEGAWAALLLEGDLVAASAAGPGGLVRLPVPETALAGRLDAIDAQGRSLLDAPVDFVRPVEWLGWSATGSLIEGAFHIPGVTAPVLVQAFDGDTLMFQALARHTEDAHRFAGHLTRLWALGHLLTLRPALNRLELDHPLTLGTVEPGLAGYLEATNAPVLQGWVLDLANLARPVPIELRIDGTPFAVVQPNLDRADLLHLTGGAIPSCGFTVPFPPGIPPTRTVTLSAFVAESGIELAGSPYRLQGVPHRITGSLDVVAGKLASGWAYDAAAPAEKLLIEAICRGEVIGTGRADRHRADLAAAGLPGGDFAFRIHLDRPLEWLLGREVTVRAVADGTVLPTSHPAPDETALLRYLERPASLTAALQTRVQRAMTHRTRTTRLSLLMLLQNSPADPALATVASVLAQWSGQWELLCLHPADLTQAPAHGLPTDPRIRLIPAPPDFLGSWQAGLAAATGDWVAPLAPGTILQPQAIDRLLMAGLAGADFAYGDEAILSDNSDDVGELRLWPAFSHDHVLSHPDLPPFFAARTALARKALAEAEPGATPLDIGLRLLEAATTVAHCPGILSRRPAVSVPSDQAERAVSQHLHRLGLPGIVHTGETPGDLRIEWPDDGGEVVAIIPTKDRLDLLQPCIESLLATTAGADLRIVVIDHGSTDPATLAYLETLAPPHTVLRSGGTFNFARLNNEAVRAHGGTAPYLLFLNNDIVAIEPGWLQRLRSLVARPGVGAAAPLLLYPDHTVQHAGVLMGFNGGADHLQRHASAYAPDGTREPGPLGSLTAIREYAALTAACLMVRHDAFAALAGFDERFSVAFNDTDLCLRLAEAGLRCLYDGRTILHHHESASRGPGAASHAAGEDALLRLRWPAILRSDPFYNPLLTLTGRDHDLRQENDCPNRFAPRLRPGPASPAP